MKERLAGIGFLLVMAALLGVCVASYMKVFTPGVDAVVEAPSAGMQMSIGADVKLHGVLVGEVRDVESKGKGARLSISLDPVSVDKVPSDVTARLLPKTLFGEKYVDLEVPKHPSGGTITAGSVIKSDRSATAVELDDVLDGALPLLRAVPPEKLSVTLTSIADALDGRGDKLGETIVKLGDVVRTLNKEMPTIKKDINALADVLDNYRGALPDLVKVLRNLTVTNRTIADQSDQLQSLWTSTQDFSDETRTFLDRYEGRLVQFGQVSEPVLRVLAEYAPEYPCLFEGLQKLQPNIEDAFSNGRLHITLEIVRNNGKYESGRDEPDWAADLGPSCRNLPNPGSHAPERHYDNGYDYDGSRVNLPIEIPGLTDATSSTEDDSDATGSGSGSDGSDTGVDLPFDPDMGYAGTKTEQKAFAPLVAASTGRNLDEVNGGLISMLYGPIFRGATVSAY
ncbi:MAG TPA: MCE family protein [Stackebrandtia sp.]|jgi:phospholipid/cholesterol/gamma-HCH transport system substrate-binding protein|uniref:MCE family protein n=1 Tax=Stackebrandtia sp. TaxID=2023065 RepID=UPI002D35DBFE|nr:MCE family protein [Stackebrandtia sp.]HZE38581.1 MCE family protein [Stackebrandtia sp.]